MAIDPVCKMEVDPKTAPAKTDYKGTTYYFCNPGARNGSRRTPRGSWGRGNSA
ncbi:MAG: YHS domain-containing protein [Bacillota bacterium]